MFKSLIATCLFTFSCSSGSLKVEKPRREYVPNATINGTYTFNNEFDFTNGMSLSFDDSFDITLYVYRTGVSNKHTLTPCKVTDFTFYTSDDDFYLSFDYIVSNGYNDGQYDITFETTNLLSFEIYELTNHFEGTTDTRFVHSELFVKNFMITFNSTFVLSGEQLSTFQSLFNAHGNMYTSYYSGWYTYRTGQAWHDNDFDFELQDSTFLVDNQFYNSYVHQDDIVYYSGTNLASGNTYTFDVWNTPNKYTVVAPVYVSAMIPYSVEVIMSVEGAFEYIVVPTDTTWYQMILAVMDAPIYYLTSLFDFKMFGISLFVAFSSLLTLLLVVTIIKKVA